MALALHPVLGTTSVQWFQANAAFIYAIGTLLLLALLAWLIGVFRRATAATQAVAEEMKQTRAWEVRPYLVFGLEILPGRPVYAFLRNIGRTPGIDIGVVLNEDLVYTNYEKEDEELHLNNVSFLKHTACLVPGQEIRTCLETTSDRFYQRNRGAKLSGMITYKDFTGHSFQESFLVDTDDLINVVHVVEPSLDDIVKALSGIQRTMETIRDKPSGA